MSEITKPTVESSKNTESNSQGISEVEKKDTGETTQFNPDKRVDFVGDEVFQLFDKDIWYNLDVGELDMVISLAYKYIVDDLGIKDPPLLKYEFFYDENEAGMYIPEENTVILGLGNIDEPTLILEILAHELRHCWQEERINQADEDLSDFDKVLKFNSENYILPLDNYLAYKTQPLEVDANLYAKSIVDLI